MIDPQDGAEQWDTLRIGSTRSPGAMRLSGHDLKFGWDIQNATGSAGATTKRINEPLKEFDAEFDLSNDPDSFGITDFDNWDAFQALLESSVAGKTPFAFDVYHPDLARNHITSVTVGSISGMALDGKGGGKIKVHFLEFRPPKPASSTAVKKGTAPKNEADRRIEDEIARTERLNTEWAHLNEPQVSSLGSKL